MPRPSKAERWLAYCEGRGIANVAEPQIQKRVVNRTPPNVAQHIHPQWHYAIFRKPTFFEGGRCDGNRA